VSPLQHAGVEVQLLARPLLGALHANVRTSRGDAEAASASSQRDVLPRRRGPARRTRRGARSPSIFLGTIRLGFVRLVRRSKPRRPALPEQCMRHPPLSKARLPLSINFRRSSVPRQQPDAAPFSHRPSVTFVDEVLTTTRLRSACPSSLPLPRFVRPAWSASTARQSASSAPLTARSNKSCWLPKQQALCVRPSRRRQGPAARASLCKRTSRGVAVATAASTRRTTSSHVATSQKVSSTRQEHPLKKSQAPGMSTSTPSTTQEYTSHNGTRLCLKV